MPRCAHSASNVACLYFFAGAALAAALQLACALCAAAHVTVCALTRHRINHSYQRPSQPRLNGAPACVNRGQLAQHALDAFAGRCDRGVRELSVRLGVGYTTRVEPWAAHGDTHDRRCTSRRVGSCPPACPAAGAQPGEKFFKVRSSVSQLSPCGMHLCEDRINQIRMCSLINSTTG